MKRIPWSQIGFILSVLIASWAEPARTQSQNRQAMTWFEAGLREREPQKKIDAYTKASELDPSFVEALFNLGLAYEEKRDYVRAEEHIRRAYNVKPDKLESALKFKIVYALANVNNKLGKYDGYEKSLQQAKALAGNQETLAKLSFELGRLMYQQRRYEEALIELTEGQKYVTRDRENYDNLILLAEKAARWEKLYAAAEREKARGQ
jgi:tetratricopeptide (TPR) repeat protein